MSRCSKTWFTKCRLLSTLQIVAAKMLANSAIHNERNFINTLLCIHELNHFLGFFLVRWREKLWTHGIYWFGENPHCPISPRLFITLCPIHCRMDKWYVVPAHSCLWRNQQPALTFVALHLTHRWQRRVDFRACLSGGCHVTVGCVCNRCKPPLKTCHENTFGA